MRIKPNNRMFLGALLLPIITVFALQIPASFSNFPRRVTLEAPATTLYHGQLTGTAGTAVALPSQAVLGVSVKALPTNTGVVYIGTTGVTSANGYPLNANESHSMSIDNLNKISFVTTVTNDGIAYIAPGF